MPKQYYPNNHSNHTNRSGGSQGHNSHEPNRDADVEPNPYGDYSCSGNLGMLYTRCYYGEINLQVLDKVSIKIMEKAKVKKNNHQSLYYASRNDNLIKQSKQFEGVNSMPNANVEPIPLKTIYPGLLIGVGIPHAAKHEGEVQLGLLFDHSTGLPYIPGSSVKGLLRSLFPLQDVALADKFEKKASDYERKNQHEKAQGLRNKAKQLLKQADEKRSFIANQIPNFPPEMVDDLERSIFEGKEYDKEKDKYVQTAGRDIFFDAFPTESKSGLLGTDFITPHTNGEFQNPTPIQFMRIAPEVTFRFEFKLRDSKKCAKVFCDATSKRNLFQTILTTIGIGAKTNVGYGQLTST